MSVVAFLASTVDADVAAAAAHTTMEKLGISAKASREVSVKKESGGIDVDAKTTSNVKDNTKTDEKSSATAPVPNYEEEQRISKLTCQYIGKQVEKFETRLAQFQELEAIVE